VFWGGGGEGGSGVEKILLEKISVIGHTQLQWQKKRAQQKKMMLGVVVIFILFLHKGQTEIASNSESLRQKKLAKRKPFFLFFWLLSSNQSLFIWQ
jgi:hypothetical protein